MHRILNNLTEFHGTPFDSSQAATRVMRPWNFMRSYLFVDVHGVTRSFQVSDQTVTVYTTVALGKAAALVALSLLRCCRLKMEKSRAILQHSCWWLMTSSYSVSDNLHITSSCETKIKHDKQDQKWQWYRSVNAYVVWTADSLTLIWLGWRGGLVVGRRTCDLVVTGSRPGHDAAA